MESFVHANPQFLNASSQAIKTEQQLTSKDINQDNKPYGHSEKLDRN